ncbi:MAG: DUF4136 domain-containing protein [Polyangiaceae bacterium]
MHSRPLFWVARLALSVVALCAIGGCASELVVHTITAQNAQFGRYRTFSFDPSVAAPDKYVVAPQSAEVRSHIEQASAKILEARGYTLAATGGSDLVVRVETGRRQSPVEETPLPPTGEAHDTGGTQIAFGGAPLDDERHDLVEGSFVIDAFDGQTHQMLWHSAAREVIDASHVDYDRLQRAIEKVMASFPARTSS